MTSINVRHPYYIIYTTQYIADWHIVCSIRIIGTIKEMLPMSNDLSYVKNYNKFWEQII